MRINPNFMVQADTPEQIEAREHYFAEQEALEAMKTPETPDEIKAHFTELWDADKRIEAMEIVFGEPIDTRDIQQDSRLSTVYMMPDAEQAWQGIKLLVESVREAPAADQESDTL